MQAVQGYYDNGRVRLYKPEPAKKAEVIVLFPEKKPTFEMSDDEAMRLFHKFTGSIDRDFDYEKERDEYLNENHGPFN